MSFRIKKITEPKGNRCYVTIEEIDVDSKPTGREFTEPFSTLEPKDWNELKDRFKNRIQEDDQRISLINSIRTEAENAKITQIITT